MIRTKDKPELAGAFHTAVNASLIEISSEEVHAIGTAQVIGPISVDIPDTRTVRLLNDRSDPEMILDILPVLKRNAVGIHKSKVGDARLELRAQGDGLRESLTKEVGQPLES